jgi:hypothetical protein
LPRPQHVERGAERATGATSAIAAQGPADGLDIGAVLQTPAGIFLDGNAVDHDAVVSIGSVCDALAGLESACSRHSLTTSERLGIWGCARRQLSIRSKSRRFTLTVRNLLSIAIGLRFVGGATAGQSHPSTERIDDSSFCVA